jgi:hypothetical protein
VVVQSLLMTGVARRDSRFWVIAGLGLCLFLVGATLVQSPSANAYTTPKACGTLEAHGKTYAIRGHLVGCRFARRASGRFLRQGIRPDGWSCVRYSPQQTSIAFTCSRGYKDFYAIRR